MKNGRDRIAMAPVSYMPCKNAVKIRPAFPRIPGRESRRSRYGDSLQTPLPLPPGIRATCRVRRRHELGYKDEAEATQNTQKKDATSIGIAHAIPSQQGEAQ
jgi:hypothetical protein